MAAAKRDLRAHQASSAAALEADWQLRTPPLVGCLRGSRAADVRLLPSPVEFSPALEAAASNRSNNSLPITWRQRKASASRPRALPDPGNAAVSTARIGGAITAGEGVPQVRRYRASHRLSPLSRRSSSPNRLPVRWNRAAMLGLLARCPAQQFPGMTCGRTSTGYRRLDKLCRLWGYFDEKRIFSKDLTLPSKMKPMRIGLIGNARRMLMRLAMRRHSQPQKDEVRKQLIAMLKQLVVERAGPDAWMSCVHLVRPPRRPRRPRPPVGSLDS
jgi:hypothetical protein